MSTEHYDVIIIGTGAGGGTLAHRLAPSGKRILLLERGDYLPREQENWDPRRYSAKSATSPARSGTTRTATPSSRTSTTSSAATPSSTGRSSSVCASATSTRSSTTAASRRRGRSLTHDLEPYYTEAEKLYLVHGEQRRGPDRAAALGRRSRSPRSRHEPRIQQLHDDFAGDRPSPVPPAGRHRPRTSRPRGEPLRALRLLRRLPLPDRRQGRRPRAAACGRRCGTTTSR